MLVCGCGAGGGGEWCGRLLGGMRVGTGFAGAEGAWRVETYRRDCVVVDFVDVVLVHNRKW